MKNFQENNCLTKNKTENSFVLLYFKTAKKLYDRYIKLSPNSIINFLFINNDNSPSNLDLVKIKDEQYKIKIKIISNRVIKKGEILSLNKELLNFK